MQRLPVPCLALALCLLSFTTATANWEYNGTRLGGLSQAFVNDAVPDGAGGAIIVWTEQRFGDYDIYIRRIDGNGNPLWTTDGVAVCSALNNQDNAALISDGAGGAIVTWRDARTGTYDVYAQRISSTGVPTWTANGVAICTAAADQAFTMLVSDGAGGAIIAWQDARNGIDWDVYARRVNSAGTVQWAANGVPVCTATAGQTGPEPVADGAGGVMIVWVDARSGPGNNNIFGQRLNASGVAQWTANGVPVCTFAGTQGALRATTDAAGGVIACWEDDRNGTKDIYAQRLNGSGNQVWTTDGVGVCTETGDSQANPSIVADGAGGIIAAWEDFRTGLTVDAYVQRITSLGIKLWSADGVPLSIAAGQQSTPRLVSDGAQGAIVAWADSRDGLGNTDVYAGHVTANGAVLWELDGVAVGSAESLQDHAAVVSDGAGGMIAGWSDHRSGDLLVYAQRVELRYGMWGRPEPTIKSAVDNPSDQGGKVIVRWVASQRDVYYAPGITFYSVWRATDVAAFASATSEGRATTDPRAFKRERAPATVWKETTLSGPVYWESVGSINATYTPTYSFTAPTRQDSTVVNPATTYFRVLAHEAPDPGSRIWESGTVSARSVDNVAPAAPILLAIQQSGSNVVLTWKPVDVPDLDHYTLYRAAANGVRAIAANFLTDATLPNHTDFGGAGGNYYYVVTATDIHGNESTTSNEVSLSGATTVDETPPIRTLTVRPNSPNPFSTRTDLNLGLPRAAEVTMELFDIGGRRVLSRSLGMLPAGWQKVALQATDERGHALANGVYFYRVHMGGATVTNKLVIAR
jgi:hypothetical protein